MKMETPITTIDGRHEPAYQVGDHWSCLPSAAAADRLPSGTGRRRALAPVYHRRPGQSSPQPYGYLVKYQNSGVGVVLGQVLERLRRSPEMLVFQDQT